MAAFSDVERFQYLEANSIEKYFNALTFKSDNA